MVRSYRRSVDVKKRLRIETLEHRHLLAAEGLISHWPLDIRNSGMLHDEVGNNHLSAFPVNQFVDSDRGRAAVFTGQVPEVSNRDANLHEFENAVTVAAWINSDDIARGGYAFAVSPVGVQLQALGNQLQFNVTTANGPEIIDNQAAGTFEFESETWYHIAGTFNGEQLVAYVNGVEVGTSNATGTLKMDGDIFVGSGWTPSDSLIRDFRGRLDDIKLFNRALASEQVRALAEQPSTLETSDDASFFDPELKEPVFIDPRVEISSERATFDRGVLVAAFKSPSHPEGDTISIAPNEQISVEGENVYFTREGTSTRIGEILGGDHDSVIVRFTEAATPAAAEALARAFVYDTDALTPETFNRQIIITLATHDGAPTFADERMIVFQPQGDSPVALETSAGASEFNPGSDPIVIDPQIEVSSNQVSFDGGSLTVSFAEDSGRDSDRLSIRPTASISRVGNTIRWIGGPLPAPVIGTFSGGQNGDPLVVQLNENASADATEALARAITYLNTSDETPDHPRFVRFVLADAAGRDASDVKKIEIASSENQPPEITTPDGATVFTEGAPPVTVLPSVSITDPDSPDFAGGTLRVTFAEESAREGDRLSVSSTELITIDGGDVFLSNVEPPQRIGEVDVLEEGRIVVFSFNEHVGDDLAELIARTVRFGNETANPASGNRFIRFTLTDGDGGSDADIRRIEVDNVNNSPLIEFSGGAAAFTEGSEPILVDPGVEVGDGDSVHFGGGKLIASFAEESRRLGDQLGLRGSDAILIVGNDVHLVDGDQSIKIADFLTGEGELVIVFTEQASVAAVQRVARRITFGNDADEVSGEARFVRFTVVDADGGSGSDVRRVEITGVNDPPVIEFSVGATEFNEDSPPVPLDGRVEIGDPDSSDFGGGNLVASFAEQSRQEGDFLGLRGSEQILIDGSSLFISGEGSSTKIGEFGSAESSLVIEFNEHASVAVVQQVARHITFGSELDEVSEGTRFVRFTIDDGDGGEAFDLRRIEVGGTNDAPSVDAGDEATEFDVLDGSVIIAPRIEVGDVDSQDLAGGLLAVAMIQQSGAEGDSFGIRDGEGIQVDGNRVFVFVDGEQKLVGEIRDASGDELAMAIDFTEHATPALAQRLARRITFQSTAEFSGEDDARFVRFFVADGDGGSDDAIKRIDLVRPDEDLDGVDDEIEAAAPFDGDGNQDGVPDSQQHEVASVRGHEDRFVTIASPEHTRLLNVQAVAEPSGDDRPAETQFPVGFFDFQLDGISASEVTMVTVFLQPGTSANTYYIFGPTPDDPNPHWYPFLFDGQTGAKIYGDRIELHFMDGARGDSDLTPNGVIADPGAPAMTVHPWQNPSRIGDVNNDGATSALDALLIINDLARNAPRALPVVPRGSDQLAELFLDVSGDDKSSALDALRVINLLARNAAAASQDSELVSVFGMINIEDDEHRWDEAIEAIVGELF